MCKGFIKGNAGVRENREEDGEDLREPPDHTQVWLQEKRWRKGWVKCLIQLSNQNRHGKAFEKSLSWSLPQEESHVSQDQACIMIPVLTGRSPWSWCKQDDDFRAQQLLLLIDYMLIGWGMWGASSLLLQFVFVKN